MRNVVRTHLSNRGRPVVVHGGSVRVKFAVVITTEPRKPAWAHDTIHSEVIARISSHSPRVGSFVVARCEWHARRVTAIASVAAQAMMW
jgi:uncharacterized membrane-anchored protein